MKLTGIADEAGAPLERQITATQALGWDSIEARFVEVPGFEKGSVHEIPDEAFDIFASGLEEAGIKVSGVGSTIGNWAHSIEDSFEITEGEIERCIARMKRLDSKIVRVMTYAILKDDDGNVLPEQHADERFTRVAEIKKRFEAAGITPVHENCMNYGGMGPGYAMELQAAVPGLKWVYDTGNPVFNRDRNKPEPFPMQDPWEMWETLREHSVHVHIKDVVWNEEKNECDYCMPGEGDGQVVRVLQDLKDRGYEGYISIEPHVAAVFHDADGDAEKDPEAQAKWLYESYVQYGEKMKALIAGLG
ncbi:MAG: sugar phosphate isomerase/epimerase [Verrucomicrobiales bacterium]|jgi:sugar phosphate isomerase/epimerase